MRKSVIFYSSTCVLFLVSLVLAWKSLPARVATHFDSAGQPNDWSSRGSYVVGMTGLGVIAFIVVPLVGAIAARHPGRYINISNRQYWARPENHLPFKRKLTVLTLNLGTLAGLVFLFVNVMVLRANSVKPVSTAALPGAAVVVLVAFIAGAFLIYWLAGRRPPESQ